MERIKVEKRKIFDMNPSDKYFINKEVEPPHLYVSLIRYNNIKLGIKSDYAYYLLKNPVLTAVRRRVFCVVIEDQYSYWAIDTDKLIKNADYPDYAPDFLSIDHYFLNEYSKNTYDKKWEKNKPHVLKYRRIYKNVTIHNKKHRNEHFKYQNKPEVIEKRREFKRQVIGKQGSLF